MSTHRIPSAHAKHIAMKITKQNEGDKTTFKNKIIICGPDFEVKHTPLGGVQMAYTTQGRTQTVRIDAHGPRERARRSVHMQKSMDGASLHEAVSWRGY